MTKDIVYGPKEEVEFKAAEMPKLEETKVKPKTVTRVRLDETECGIVRIAPIHKEIVYTDYSDGEPKAVIMEIDITPLPISEKKQILKRCTTYDRAGVPEVDFEKMEDMMIAKMLGLTEDAWRKFKTNHPIGIYTKISLLVRDINGEVTFSEAEIDELKNSEGREQ